MASQLKLQQGILSPEVQAKMTLVYSRFGLTLEWTDIQEETNRIPLRPKAIRRRYDKPYVPAAKPCLMCSITKEASEFPVSNNRTLRICRACDDPNNRVCKRCHVLRPDSEYYSHSRFVCKPCKAEQKRLLKA